MPRKDGTCPSGQGAMTGRGLGLCQSSAQGSNFYGRRNAGLNGARNSSFSGARYGRGFNCFRNNAQLQDFSREQLLNQKAVLEDRLNFINKSLDK